ncbi:hypothetical protein QEP66_00925 [Streptomyces sp. LB8]|uniref:hypothetical protein n=1 Tax=Streptomyces sp. LB8 TaxID=3042509 RepID=UPI002649B273|nr:hypothetical protein [Streptomyces sp. LB8]MDN5380693.1 hypothetical protein [Streptomyces sp. LB8]
MHYDRTLLHRAARAAGDINKRGEINARAVARRLGVGPMAAWRLVRGIGRPSTVTAAAVERAYGLPATALVRPLDTDEEATR